MKKLRTIGWVVAACVCVGSLLYAVVTQPISGLIRDASAAAGIAWVILTIALIYWHITVLRPQQNSAIEAGEPIPVLSGAAGMVLLAGLVLSAVIVGLATVAHDIFAAVFAINSRGAQVTVAVAMAGLVGMALFFVRLKLRFIYGVSEALVGLGVVAHRAFSEPNPTIPTQIDFYLAVLTAGIYLVVRGLDNVHQGVKDENDPIMKRVRKHAQAKRPDDLPGR